MLRFRYRGNQVSSVVDICHQDTIGSYLKDTAQFLNKLKTLVTFPSSYSLYKDHLTSCSDHLGIILHEWLCFCRSDLLFQDVIIHNTTADQLDLISCLKDSRFTRQTGFIHQHLSHCFLSTLGGASFEKKTSGKVCLEVLSSPEEDPSGSKYC